MRVKVEIGVRVEIRVEFRVRVEIGVRGGLGLELRSGLSLGLWLSLGLGLGVETGPGWETSQTSNARLPSTAPASDLCCTHRAGVIEPPQGSRGSGQAPDSKTVLRDDVWTNKTSGSVVA